MSNKPDTQIPLCACDQFYDSHPPDCPVVPFSAKQAFVERVKAKWAAS